MFYRPASIVITVAVLASCTAETVEPVGVGLGTAARPSAQSAGPEPEPEPEPASEYDLVELTLPSGDPSDGRQAFSDLRCTGCHRVADEPGLPAPVSDSAGPDLGPELAQQPLGILVTSIVAPSHAMSIRTSPDTRERVDGVLSPMGDCSEVMTVRQLLDILAYLEDVRRAD